MFHSNVSTITPPLKRGEEGNREMKGGSRLSPFIIPLFSLQRKLKSCEEKKKKERYFFRLNRSWPICALLADPPSILTRTRRRDGDPSGEERMLPLSTMTVALLSKRRNRFDSRAHLHEKQTSVRRLGARRGGKG